MAIRLIFSKLEPGIFRCACQPLRHIMFNNRLICPLLAQFIVGAQFVFGAAYVVSRRGLRLCALLLTVACGLRTAECLGQTELLAQEDRIIYGPALPRSSNVWNPPPAITLTGKIEKLDQSFLEFTSSAGQQHKLPSDRIERVEVAWANADAASAHARYAHREYLLALKKNDEVLRGGGIPKWQQCILLAELVESAEAIGRPEVAGQLFLVLTQQKPADFLTATIPLNWTSRELTPALEKAARDWLARPDDYAGLLGASWLLLTDEAEAAKKRLQAIQANPSKLMQRLATMQLWRATPPSETTGNIRNWSTARDTLSLPLQLGPTEFMAERFARVDKTNLAIGEWLRIAATHAHHPHRAQAALEAAQLRLGRLEDKSASKSAAAWLNELSIAVEVEDIDR